jgi:salicylate hydroxylase
MCQCVGKDLITTSAEIVDYREEEDGVVAILSDGREVKGDVLVGADGIRLVVLQDRL